jgi:hypothetical protein
MTFEEPWLDLPVTDVAEDGERRGMMSWVFGTSFRESL